MRSTCFKLIHLQILLRKRLQQILTLQVTCTKKLQQLQVLQRTINNNLHHLPVLLKILNVKKMEWILVLMSKLDLWWKWMTIIWFSTWMVFLWWLVRAKLDPTYLVVFRPGLKEFLSTCVKKFMVYIWSSAMKKNFLRHLDIIAKKTGVFLPSSKILD